MYHRFLCDNNTFVLHLFSPLTINALQRAPGPLSVGRLLGLGLDALYLLRAETQQQDKDQRDQEAGQQQYGHHDDLLLIHTDLCSGKRETRTTLELSPWCWPTLLQ